MNLTPDAMKDAFHAKRKERAAVLAKLDPLVAKRDKIANDARAKLLPLDDEIKAIKAPLYDLDMEIGMIARALGGKTGPTPEE